MSAIDSSSNGGAPAVRAVVVPRSGEPERTIESLTVAVGKLRRGAEALKAENRELRAEIAGLEREATGRRNGDAPIRDLTRLVAIALPSGPRASGAARCVVDHCLSGLVARRVLHDTELLVGELVADSLDHGDPGDGDSVVVSIYLGTDNLRLEIENPGGSGLDLVDVLAARWGVIPNGDTSVWFEMARV